jgi:peptidyl-prolyl cis-trans isomerase A (cyclophilin A)
MNLMNFKSTILALAGALAACGGSGLETTTISPDRLMYGSVATLVVRGVNLDKGITMLVPQCTGMLELSGGTATQRVYTCTPDAVGDISASVIGGGITLHSVKLTVPQPRVHMKTSMGEMLLELDPIKAPISVKNFLQYVNADFYKSLIFHRVIPNFVIQTGGFDANLVQVTPRAPIKLEVPNGLSNLRGTVAMARTSVADSGTSQFYINAVDNVSLDTLGGGYAVFGKVLTGFEIVDAISAVPTAVANGMTDVPVTTVTLLSMVQTQ